jgi:hypothetical protein
MSERLVRAAVRVAPVTEQGRRCGIGRLGGQGRFEGRHVIKACREAPRAVPPTSAGSRDDRRVGLAEPVKHHGHVVVGDECAGRLAQRAVSVGDPRSVQQFQCGTKLSDPSVLQRHIDERLGLGLTMLRVESSGKVQSPQVERVQSQGFGQQTFCLIPAAEPTKQHDAQVTHLQLVRACLQSRRRTFER